MHVKWPNGDIYTSPTPVTLEEFTQARESLPKGVEITVALVKV